MERCAACGEPFSRGSIPGRRHRLEAEGEPFHAGEDRYCEECAEEIFRGRIRICPPRVAFGSEKGIADPDPSGENAVRFLEGD